MRSVEERFWEKADWENPTNRGCWLWTAATHPRSGYGFFGVTSGVAVYAHRWAWEWAFGPIPPGLVVRHECDSPPCVNPAHFLLGTQLDNIADRQARGRQRSTRGEESPLAKFSQELVLEMRAAYALGGITQTEIARLHGTSVGHAHNIVRRKARKYD